MTDLVLLQLLAAGPLQQMGTLELARHTSCTMLVLGSERCTSDQPSHDGAPITSNFLGLFPDAFVSRMH